MHKSQVLMLILGGIIIGITFASFVRISSELTTGVVVTVVVLVLLGLRKEVYLVLAVVLLAVLAGGLRFQSVAMRTSELKSLADSEVRVDGMVAGDFSTTSSGRGQFHFLVREVSNGSGTASVREKILVSVLPVPRYAYGESLEIVGTLRIPESFDGFDYPSYLRISGIHLVMQAKDIQLAGEQPIDESLGAVVWKKIFRTRDSFANTIESSVSEPAGGYVKGILLGLRSDLPTNIKEAFARTGTSHVLAISGYNITIVIECILAGLVYFMRRQRAIWIIFLGLIVFTIMTGASASVVRAAIMGVVVLIASGVGRLSDGKQVLLLAASGMALVNPYVVRFDVGFQLSFAAVAGLMFIQPGIEVYIKKVFRSDFLTKLVSATTSAQIAVAPLLAFTFGSLSLVLLPANILVLPFVPITMFLGFFTGLAGLVWPPMGHAIGILTWAIAEWQISVVIYLGQLPWAAVPLQLSGWATVGLYVALISVVLIFKRRKEIQNIQP